MRNLDGMEMTCFTKGKPFELEYSGGKYLDLKGEPVTDLADMNCYVCTTAYYTRESEPIPFCPNCGHFEKKRFTDQKELAEVLRGQNFSWLAKNKQKAFYVKRIDNRLWELKFARDAAQLQQSAAYDIVTAV